MLITKAAGMRARAEQGRNVLFDVSTVKVRLDVALKLGLEERGALLTAALVANRVVDVDFREDGAVVESDSEAVRDEALLCKAGLLSVAASGLPATRSS